MLYCLFNAAENVEMLEVDEKKLPKEVPPGVVNTEKY